MAYHYWARSVDGNQVEHMMVETVTKMAKRQQFESCGKTWEVDFEMPAQKKAAR